MKETEEIMVDTLGFMTPCKRLPGLLLLVSECARCQYHLGVLEIWPGIKGEPVEVKETDMTVETYINNDVPEGEDPIDTGKNRLYDIRCGLPQKTRAIIFAKFPEKE